MINVDQAKKIILKDIPRLKKSETIDISSCLGRVCAADIKSKDNIPPFDNSAMDGFAIRAKDSEGASRQNPIALEVIEDLPAGRVAIKKVRHLQAIRIMTGAPLPKGADAVIMVEETRRKEQRAKSKELVEIFKEVKPGENVRRAGEDVKKGELVIKKGTVLKSGHIGMLASLGFSRIRVSRKPRVSILVTGDELVEISQKLKPGKIRNSNAYSLYAQALKAGALPLILGIARDSKKDLEQKIRKGLVGADALIVSGGISVGDYDFVKGVLKGLGARMKFWKVAMRPGKPMAFGVVGTIPVFGLPGNPVSSMVSFEIFVRPAILKMLGQTEGDIAEVDAVIEEDIEKKPGLRYFLRAITRWDCGRYLAKTTGPQGSSLLKSMARANSLVILPEDVKKVKKGESVKVRFLD